MHRSCFLSTAGSCSTAFRRSPLEPTTDLIPFSLKTLPCLPLTSRQKPEPSRDSQTLRPGSSLPLGQMLLHGSPCSSPSCHPDRLCSLSDFVFAGLSPTTLFTPPLLTFSSLLKRHRPGTAFPECCRPFPCPFAPQMSHLQAGIIY